VRLHYGSASTLEATVRAHNSIALSGTPVITRNEGVDLNWGSGINSNIFSTRWIGRVVLPPAGSYRLQTESDQGVRLWFNGEFVINNWTSNSKQTNTSSTFSYLAGQQVDVLIEYDDGNGSAVVRLQWRTPESTTCVAVPATQLTTP
jgi:hypothetical protein